MLHLAPSGQLCGIGSLLPPLHEFQRLSSLPQACCASVPSPLRATSPTPVSAFSSTGQTLHTPVSPFSRPIAQAAEAVWLRSLALITTKMNKSLQWKQETAAPSLFIVLLFLIGSGWGPTGLTRHLEVFVVVDGIFSFVLRW